MNKGRMLTKGITLWVMRLFSSLFSPLPFLQSFLLKPRLSFYVLTFLLTHKCSGEVTLVCAGFWVLPTSLGAGFRMGLSGLVSAEKRLKYTLPLSRVSYVQKGLCLLYVRRMSVLSVSIELTC